MTFITEEQQSPSSVPKPMKSIVHRQNLEFLHHKSHYSFAYFQFMKSFLIVNSNHIKATLERNPQLTVIQFYTCTCTCHMYIYIFYLHIHVLKRMSQYIRATFRNVTLKGHAIVQECNISTHACVCRICTLGKPHRFMPTISA